MSSLDCLQGARAAAASGDKRLDAVRQELEMAKDRVTAANASLAEARDMEAEVCACAPPSDKCSCDLLIELYPMSMQVPRSW